jgi:propanol-preferring alcohol dehydrogenase
MEMVPPHLLDAVISFAPAGQIVPRALALLSKGGRLVMAGVYVSPLPEMDYELLYHERSILSVSNSTRADATEFLDLAGKIPLRAETTVFSLDDAKTAFTALKQSKYRGAGVFRMGA